MFSSVFKGYKIETLTRNGLNYGVLLKHDFLVCNYSILGIFSHCLVSYTSFPKKLHIDKPFLCLGYLQSNCPRETIYVNSWNDNQTE